MSGYKFRRGKNYVKPPPKPKTEAELARLIVEFEIHISKARMWKLDKFMTAEIRDRHIAFLTDALRKYRKQRADIVLKETQ